MNLDLSAQVMEKLTEIAKECNLSVEKACEIILSEFARVQGGRIYVGAWKEGGGLMFAVQWPFLTGFIKLKDEELAKVEVK